MGWPCRQMLGFSTCAKSSTRRCIASRGNGSPALIAFLHASMVSRALRLTNRLERFNLTLRQRVGRLTRKTLSFSKSYPMHLIHIRRFLLQYNQYCIHWFNQSHHT